MGKSIDLELAEANALAAREKLTDTLVDIQQRLNPQTLFVEATKEVRERAGELVVDGIDAARRNPAAAAAVATAATGWLLRAPILRVARHLLRKKNATRPDDRELTARAISAATKLPPPPEPSPRSSNDDEQGDRKRATRRRSRQRDAGQGDRDGA